MKYPSLKDKVVVVTGASSGLGAALARAFAENESTLYIAARNGDKLRALAQELGSNVLPVSLDVTKSDEVNHLGERVVRASGRIDIWINNAGMDRKVPLEELTPEVLHEITAVNYFGLVYGTRAAAQQMKKQKFGDIVQILSTSAFTPRSNESPYAGAKAAAKLFSESVRGELASYGIRIIPVYPGGMDTEFFRKANLTLPKDSMDPKDVADVILNTLIQPRNVVVNPYIFRQEMPLDKG